MQVALEQSWKDLTAAGTVIWDATAEFFERHNSSNCVTLVALRRPASTNDFPTLVKYVDRNYAVLLLPVLPGAESGWCTFTIMYNHRVLDLADQYAISGQPDKALELYRLIAHFDCCQTLASLSRRINLAEHISNGKDVAASIREISDMRSHPAASVLAPGAPTIFIPTTNLIGVTVETFSKR